MSEIAIRTVLGQLHLSPDTIDTVAAAVNAHARDPIHHPVDRDLTRLCTSEYTRGALQALSWYLAETRSVANGSEADNTEVDKTSHLKAAASSASAVVKKSKMDGESQPTFTINCGDREALSPLVAGNQYTAGGSMTGKLSTIWNRLRRTRSMPSREYIESDTGSVGTDIQNLECSDPDHDLIAGVGSRLACKCRTAGTRNCATTERLDTRVKSSSTPKKFLTSLGLGCHRSNPAGFDLGTPPKALVRTGRWKLGHEIGKGSFGAVHIGLNEDSGDLIAVKVIPVRTADIAEPLYREVELMRHLTHPNIVRYLGAEVRSIQIMILSSQVPLVVDEESEHQATQCTTAVPNMSSLLSIVGDFRCLSLCK